MCVVLLIEHHVVEDGKEAFAIPWWFVLISLWPLLMWSCMDGLSKVIIN